MSLSKKSDVRNHLARLNRTGIHPFRLVGQADATGFSGEETGNAAVNAENSARDSLTQPTSSGRNIPVTGAVPSSSGRLMPAASKSAQA
jgi:hypothetical protein